MTEAEWKWADNPEPVAMIESLYRTISLNIIQSFIGNVPPESFDPLIGKAVDRKLRLFTCSICRTFPDGIMGAYLHKALDTSERYADGQSTEEELTGYYDQLWESLNRFREQRYGKGLGDDPTNLEENRCLFATAACQTHKPYYGEFISKRLKDFRRFEDLIHFGPRFLRDIFWNPFRSVAFDPMWLTPTAVALANGIYADRAFDRMPILADALEEAGCDNAEVVFHCRGDGPHVRGCWVVDAVLGKE